VYKRQTLVGLRVAEKTERLQWQKGCIVSLKRNLARVVT